MAHWADKYVGMPYVKHENDCAEFFGLIQREVFGRKLPVLPSAMNYDYLRELSDQVQAGFEQMGVRVESPQEGDAVLMRCRNVVNHIGVYCLIDGVPHTLHAVLSASQVCLHRINDLPKFNISVEGYYQCKTL